MNTSVTTVRRGLFGMFAGGLLAFGSAAIVAPVVNAQPGPAPTPPADCSASNVAGTVSTAAASEGAYLAANPQTNEALTQISSQPQPEAQTAYGAFFAQNPVVEDQLKAIHEPVSNLQTQCGLQLSPTPVAQAVWNAGETAGAPTPPTAPQAPEVIGPPTAPGMTPDNPTA
ncbi:hemophore-related protein [Mycolicibacterium iranicum]|uniref:Hemophore-related protein n=1 Tax=Mycolicibacterium iranicum TaxID=912594 RepID=A0A839Q4N7_MYCIR|nr:heme-binding protein [Mycolicibacterium iranicum]MBB2990627.1 hemophore-related protein [Mycolicibacterium iranicum]